MVLPRGGSDVVHTNNKNRFKAPGPMHFAGTPGL